MERTQKNQMLTVTGFTIRLEDGSARELPLTEAGHGADETGEAFLTLREVPSGASGKREPSGPDVHPAQKKYGGLCTSFFRCASEEGLTALCLGAEIRVKAPDCGFQRALFQENGVGVDLRFGQREEAPFVAIYQHKEWWLRPAFGTKPAEIPEKTQLLIRKCDDGFEVYLAVCGEESRADLAGIPGGVRLTLSSNCAGLRRQQETALVYGRGPEPYSLTERLVRFAFARTGRAQDTRREKKFPAVLEKWGWCTWDSLGQNVSEAAIFEKMEDFKALGLTVPWVLIDDGWSMADRKRQQLAGLDADPERFPNGLASTIRVLKERYGVEQVGVWQAVKGYWNGIAPGSEAEREMNEYLVRYPNGELAVKAEAGAAFGFWNRWHRGLRQKGVSFVKVDEQSSFSLMTKGVCSFGEAARAVHAGLDASAMLHFDGNLINCMGMAPEDVWNRPASSLARNSDDFTPTVPGSFAEHAFQNCFNSIYHGCFYWEDWDMVWSVHEDAGRSILLRAISGGPFYLSDGVGKTDPSAIRPVTAEDGEILRCRDVGRPSLDCLTAGDVFWKRPLKVFNFCGGVTYVAAFTGKDCEGCEDSIRTEDLPGTVQAKDYRIYDFGKKEILPYWPEEGFRFFAEPGMAALFQLIPYEEEITVVGMTDKYISMAGIREVIRLEERILVRTGCSGELSLLCKRPPRQIRCQYPDGRPSCELACRQTGELFVIPAVEAGVTVEIL